MVGEVYVLSRNLPEGLINTKENHHQHGQCLSRAQKRAHSKYNSKQSAWYLVSATHLKVLNIYILGDSIHNYKEKHRSFSNR